MREQWGEYGPETYHRYALYWRGDRPLSDYPGVLLVHGGGWKGGNLREHNGGAAPDEPPTNANALAQHLADAGYAAMSVGYTIDPEPHSGWPVHPYPMRDAELAYDWLRARVGKVDGAVGNSAGALNIALMRRKCRRVMIAAPVGNLPRDSQIEADTGRVFGSLDRSLWPTVELDPYRDLLIHGTHDTTVPLWTLDHIRATGVETVVLTGAGHAPHRDDRYRETVWSLIVSHLVGF